MLALEISSNVKAWKQRSYHEINNKHP